MPSIPFIQFKRPRGQELDVSIDRPDNVYAKAMEIFKATFRLECEELSNGDCSFTIADGDQDYAIEVVPNGPEVPAAVDKLILEFDISKALEKRAEGIAERKRARRAAKDAAIAAAAKS